MATGFTRCQFIAEDGKTECDTWFPYIEGQIFCKVHQNKATEEVISISRTANMLSEEGVTKLNEEIQICSEMSIPDLVQHILRIEDQIRTLERQRRAANIAKRDLESKLSDSERLALRQASEKYVVPDDKPNFVNKRKSPEEKAKNRKEGFSAWAARLGVKTEDLMVMDDDEMASRIAKYKAQKGA